MAYEPGKWVRDKNRDGNWFEFVLQKRGNSCGPASVLIIKSLYSPGARYMMTEGQFRGATALAAAGIQSVSTIGAQARGLQDWATTGAGAGELVKVLKAQPVQIPSARAVTGAGPVLHALRQSTFKRPTILGWWWGKRGDSSQGGHWTVCVGPTKDGKDFTILDPWNGIQYVSNHQQSFSSYICQTEAGISKGWFDANSADVAVIATS